MKIVVALKQVPSRDSALRVPAGESWIDESDLTYEINEPDAYALEAALQLKEQQGGEVIVVCAGPEGAASSIREALARAYFRTSRFLDAQREFARVLELDPVNDYAHFGLGLCSLKTGDVEPALRNLRIAVAMRPSSADYRDALARAERRAASPSNPASSSGTGSEESPQ